MFTSQHSLMRMHGKAMKIILGILAVIVLAIGLALYFTSGIATVAKDQLAAIKSGDLASAYAMTSKAFQQQSSMDTFAGYLSRYPILKNYKNVSFSERSIENGTGSVKGVIESEDGTQLGIAFTFVKEGDKWKVQTLNVSSAGIDSDNQAPPANSGPLSIHAVLKNDSADADGYATENKTALSKSADKIFATVQIVAPDASGNAEATLVQPDGAKIGPVVGAISRAGNIMKAFSFSRSGGEWPVGNYTVIINLSSGATKTVTFSVH